MDFDNTSQCPDFIIDNINTSLYTNKEEISANYRESAFNFIVIEFMVKILSCNIGIYCYKNNI